MMVLINLPAPEVINTRLIAAKQLHQTAVFFGLSIDVGDQVFKAGIPTHLIKVPLANASFESAEFNSAGRLNGGSVEDGGVMLSTVDVETGGSLFSGFLSGRFSINFLRSGSSNTRTYAVSRPPPQEVIRRFRSCVESLR